ncbi:uncharacterized protein EV420DRAFT_1534808 [Desarmillaria tabescens]|uniref:Uncharacterized protein n=1 Tax=Armillaria tabescens TaxID=1929756 RepID=A0AA39N773_ARMTA|nr:uncharacterized protein EV420DRAFT_1534808 [Desarmillaria tabescens]KAK0460054.1 hypothetical protein EV420DRAFT_1534808 [Desarmillaria tabescens]
MLDRDEAQRLPVVIPQDDIEEAPNDFVWYEGPQGGGFTVPPQFKKYPNRPVNETPIGYLYFIVDKCSARTKNIHSAFFEAIDVYFEGLMEYAKVHYAEFIIPFGMKHRGKRLQQCRDKPWMEWTTTKPSLTQKYPIYFTAVRYFLADKRHYNVTRDIGELLSATEYEDDLDLKEVQEREGDDESENDSFIDDGDIEDEREEEESSDSADESEASNNTEESAHTSDIDGSQSYVSNDADPEPDIPQTPSRKISLNNTASLGSAYRLGKRYNSRSASPTPLSPTLRKHRRNSPDFEASLDSPVVRGASKAVNSVSKASPRKRRVSSVGSSDHPIGSDGADEDEPEARQRSRGRQKSPRKAARRARKGKHKALTSEMENFISANEESDGSEDYTGSVTENDNLSDLADGAQPRQLRSGRKYGPNMRTPSKEATSKVPSPRGRESKKFIDVEISSAVDSGSDEPSKLSTASAPKARSSPDAQRISWLSKSTGHVLI